MEKHTHCVIPAGGTGNSYAYERYPEKQLQLFGYEQVAEADCEYPIEETGGKSNMYVQVKSSNGITVVPMETKLMAERRVFIQGDITQENACEFVKQILLLNSQDPKAPIDVLVNSPGGEINAGLLMYDVIQSSPAPVRMFCMGQAYSMGAVLFASGRHGRYMLPHSELMLHEPVLGNRVGGNVSSIRSLSESMFEVRKKLNGILAKHTGQPEEVIEKQTGYDHFFGPEESVAFGLADKIVGFDMLMEEK